MTITPPIKNTKGMVDAASALWLSSVEEGAKLGKFCTTTSFWGFKYAAEDVCETACLL